MYYEPLTRIQIKPGTRFCECCIKCSQGKDCGVFLTTHLHMDSLLLSAICIPIASHGANGRWLTFQTHSYHRRV